MDIVIPNVELTKRLDSTDHFELSRREREVCIGSLAIGSGTPEVLAEQMHISPSTAKNHLYSIFKTVECDSVAQMFVRLLDAVTDDHYTSRSCNADLRAIGGVPQVDLRFTPRQIEVIDGSATFGSVDVAARQLGISSRTAKNHLAAAYMTFYEPGQEHRAKLPIAYLLLRKMDILPTASWQSPQQSQ